MSTVSQTSQAMQWIVQEYPRQMERKTGFVQRNSAQLDGPTFVQSLVFGWMARPQASYTQLRHVAATLGASVSKQAVEQRFSQASVELLKAVLQEAGKQLICSDGQVAPLLSRFTGVYLQDGSIVSLPEELAERSPGCGGSSEHSGKSSLRLQVRWEMGRGGLQGPWLQAGREAERSGEAIETPMPVGSLFIGDIGSFTLQDMPRRGADHFWITPAKSQLCLYDCHGVKCRMETFLKQHQQESQIDCWVQLGADERLLVRLIAVKVSDEQAQKRRQRARVRTCKPAHRKGAQHCGPRRKGQGGRRVTKNHRKQKRASERSLRLADWTIILSNVPAQRLSVNEVLVLMRRRGPGGITVEIVEAVWPGGYLAQ